MRFRFTFLTFLSLSFILACGSEASKADKAVDAYYEGRIEESAAILEDLLQKKPGRRDLQSRLVFLYLEQGNNAAAADLLRTMVEEGEDLYYVKELFITLCLGGNYGEAALLLPRLEGPDAGGELCFYRALLCRDRGDEEQAIALLRESLALEEFRPPAWFFLGGLLVSRDPAGAEDCFKTCLSQDPAFAEALFPLGRLLYNRGQYREALDYLDRAAGIFPRREDIGALLDECRRQLPKTAESPRRVRIDADPPKVKPLTEQGLIQVRIALAENCPLIQVKTGGSWTLGGGNPGSAAAVLSGGGSEQFWIRPLGEGLMAAEDQEGRVLFSAPGPLTLSYAEGESSSTIGAIAPVNRSYRGSLEFRPADPGVTLINILNIEEYLYGVIPSEVPYFWPAEALKAQAVAARSYTMAYLGANAEKGFDLYGSVLSAAYRGIGVEREETTAAVDATRGIYLEAGGRPLRAYYSANHGGYSEDSLSVWGYDAFMTAVPDLLVPGRKRPLPPDKLVRWIRERVPSYSSAENLHFPEAYRWERWVSAEDLGRRAAEAGPVGRVLGVISRGRGISGRVNKVEIRGSGGTVFVDGDRIRYCLGGLRSNLIAINAKLGKDGAPEFFIFQGAGYGHGVGLDQSGAAGMAGAGYSAEEILRHYYPRAALSAISNL
ncbi:MAG: SpoIID/LytB domain-containing protein [Treponema sp.]|jgi:SpoIID/LytB domain protein|nr:SpoIID/LytB domain-containing protein [Treponema sp.]